MAVYIDDLTDKETQSSPDCFVRVLRFIRRDTRAYVDSLKRPKTLVNKGVGIRHKLDDTTEETKSIALDIASDIISCTISKSKAQPVGSFTLLLSAGDINYHHAIHPGDHIFIWMKRNRVVNMRKGKNTLIDDSIANNDVSSGLKLYGVITGVRRLFRAETNGRKTLVYQITGKDFGYFFEASVYYNAAATGLISDTKVFEMTGFGTFGAPRAPDEMVRKLVDVYLGVGLPGATLKITRNGQTQERNIAENLQMFVPPGTQDIFGQGLTFTDVLKKRIGIEKYYTGIIPTTEPMNGYKPFHIDVGSNYPLWSALQAYSNPTINEMFLDLKIAEVTDTEGRITKKLFPTFTFRQIPFTSNKAASAYAVSDKLITYSEFTNLPRIKIPEKFVLSEDLGRGDHERFNFIELFGIYGGGDDLVTVPLQMLQGNYAIDVASVKRYGLRPIIMRTDYPQVDKNFLQKAAPDFKDVTATMVAKWINLLADWYLGAHTLESGSIQCIGIEEPLSIGDNIELSRQKGVSELYHVEGYTHTYVVEPERGSKTFRTSIEVTRGQRVDEYPIYSSGTLNEDDQLDIGLTDGDLENMSRSESSSSASGDGTTGISTQETPENRKKPS